MTEARRNFDGLQGIDTPHQCARCKRQARLRCSACHTKWYCSRQCQRVHWQEHRQRCEGRRGATDGNAHRPRTTNVHANAVQVKRPWHGCPWHTDAHPHLCQWCEEEDSPSAQWHTECGSGECDFCMPCADERCIEALETAMQTMGESAAIAKHAHCITVCPLDTDSMSDGD